MVWQVRQDGGRWYLVLGQLLEGEEDHLGTSSPLQLKEKQQMPALLNKGVMQNPGEGLYIPKCLCARTSGTLEKIFRVSAELVSRKLWGVGMILNLETKCQSRRTMAWFKNTLHLSLWFYRHVQYLVRLLIWTERWYKFLLAAEMLSPWGQEGFQTIRPLVKTGQSLASCIPCFDFCCMALFRDYSSCSRSLRAGSIFYILFVWQSHGWVMPLQMCWRKQGMFLRVL